MEIIVKVINEQIKTGEFQSVYLLYGEEEYLKKQYRDKLKKAISGDDTMNYSYFEGNKIVVKEVIDMANTLPFFAEKRLIIIENSGFFKSSQEELADFIKNMPDYLIFVFVESEVDKRNKVYKAVSTAGYICEMKQQSTSVLVQWIVTLLKNEGKTIDRPAVDLLLSKTGAGMDLIYAEVEKLVADTKALEEYQSEPEAIENLEKIPVLRREDISREIAPFFNEEMKLADVPVVYHEIETNGIGYVNAMFDLSGVSAEELADVGILQSVLGIIDTENYEYSELFNEINVNTGGIGTSLELYNNVTRVKEKEFKATFEIKGKALYSQLEKTFAMMAEILTASKLDDTKRIREILAMLKSRLLMKFQSSGHTTAALRALSYASPSAKFKDMTSGIDFYKRVAYIEEHFDEEKEALSQRLYALTKKIFRPDNMMISYTAAREGLEGMEPRIAELAGKLNHENVTETPCIIHCEKKNEGFKTASKVQYVARTGNFIDRGVEYTGALQILKVILSYDYLWQNIRVKGGAYGCMSSFNRIGEGYFVSYRDPNLKRTIDVYEGVVDYLENFTVSDRDMTKYIIGTISNIDQPMTPATKGERSMNLYMNKVSAEMIKKERAQILDAAQEDIRALAKVAKAVLAADQLCVIGGEEKIEEDKELFGVVTSF